MVTSMAPTQARPEGRLRRSRAVACGDAVCESTGAVESAGLVRLMLVVSWVGLGFSVGLLWAGLALGSFCAGLVRGGLGWPGGGWEG